MAVDGTFLVSINGQIEYVDLTAASGSIWHCKYEIVFGTDWKLISGLEAGVSQTVNTYVNGDKIVFNFPIELCLKSTNPYGWPQIVFSIYSGTILKGYSRVHLPFQPGLHNIKIPLSKPIPSSFLGYIASFFSYQPELLQSSLLAMGSGNHLIRMVSNGCANISLNILTKGFKELGYDFGIK